MQNVLNVYCLIYFGSKFIRAEWAGYPSSARILKIPNEFKWFIKWINKWITSHLISLMILETDNSTNCAKFKPLLTWGTFHWRSSKCPSIFICAKTKTWLKICLLTWIPQIKHPASPLLNERGSDLARVACGTSNVLAGAVTSVRGLRAEGDVLGRQNRTRATDPSPARRCSPAPCHESSRLMAEPYDLSL